MADQPAAITPSDSSAARRPLVEVHSLRKTYADLQLGEIVALQELSLTAYEGEIVGLLGPNGAGKTTALRVLATLLEPSAGRAAVNGFDCVTQPELVRRQIGYISASTAVYDRMTAWEFVEYFGQLHGIEHPELGERMERLFDRLEMQSLRDCLGSKMSTGMKQRTSIARALVHDPPLLIFDEATNGLDVLAARAVLDTVAALRDEGKCLLFSTHILREVERLCDRAVIIHAGRILAQGTLDELREEHDEQDLEELFYRLIRNAEAQKQTPEGQLASGSIT